MAIVLIKTCQSISTFTFEQSKQLKSWGREKCDVRGVDLQPEAPEWVLGIGLKMLPPLSSQWLKHFLL